MARVLLADRQPLFSEALRALLDTEGHEVAATISEREEVLPAMRRVKPDLVLIDAELALRTQPTLVEQALDELPDTNFLVLTQREEDFDEVFASVAAGAIGVVAKTASSRVMLRDLRLALDGEGVVPPAMLPQLFRRLAQQGTQPESPLSRLSPREREVLYLLSKGWDNPRIAAALFISPNTVRTHLQNILEKLQMHSKLEVATFGMQRSHELAPERNNRHPSRPNAPRARAGRAEAM